MVHISVRRILGDRSVWYKKAPLTYRYISSYYFPLALTSIMGLSIPPMVTFFLGHSRMAIESLAAYPVINSLVFIFRSLGLSYQEVGIALLGDGNEGYRPLRNFALLLGLFVVGGLSLVAFTPLSHTWFHQVSGLSLELTRFSLQPTRLLAFMPGLMVLLSFQRALMMNSHRTKHVTIATATELGLIVILLVLAIDLMDMIGVIAAAFALVSGRLMANVYLFFPTYRMLKRSRAPGVKVPSGVSTEPLDWDPADYE
jgi:hypothetical protein